MTDYNNVYCRRELAPPESFYEKETLFRFYRLASMTEVELLERVLCNNPIESKIARMLLKRNQE